MHMEAIQCKHMLRVVLSEIRMLGDAFILMCEKSKWCTNHERPPLSWKERMIAVR